MNKEKVVKGFLEKKEFTDPQSIFLNKFQLKTPIEEIEKYYLENKSKIDLNFQDEDDYYVLHQIIQLKNFSYTKFIIDNLPNKEKNINNVDSIGNSPLHLAVTLKDMEEIIRYLIKNGSDINLKNSKGQTPLHLACGKNRLENVNILLTEPSLEYNIPDNQGFTPLIKACASQAYDVVKCLLRSKDVNINMKDNIGNTGLHYLCEDEKFDVAIQMIKNGANVEFKNKDGKTPLELIKNDDVKSIILSYLKDNKDD